MHGKTFQDLTGQIFNRLTVIEFSISKNNQSAWLCQCECGEIKEIRAGDLKAGKSKSCGCYKKHKQKEKTKRSILNQKFNKLLAIEILEEKSKSGKVMWKFLCECGNIINRNRSDVVSGKTKSCGCLRTNNPKKCKENHHNWNADLTNEERVKIAERGNRSYLSEVNRWRRDIFIRDNYTCQISGEVGGKLCVHHIFNWKDYPNLRFDIDNGITLSQEIHRLFHSIYGVRYTTLEQWMEFVDYIKSALSIVPSEELSFESSLV